MNIVLAGAGRLSTPHQRMIARAVRTALGARAKRDGEICVILVGDKEIRKINKRYLNHDTPTDVISFPYDRPAPKAKGSQPFGDIYIGKDAAKRQAKELGHSLLEELLTLAVHGTLHLIGYDDRKPTAKKRMFTRQDAIVRLTLRSHGKR